MEWQYFTEVVKRLKDLTEKLEKETDKIEQTYESYRKQLQEDQGTYEELERLNKLNERLKEIQADLRNVQAKAASGKILIKFVGSTSGGKSSLINALLRSRRLPVGVMQTTMCTFKVCTTKEEEWSVTIEGTNDTETVCLAKPKNEKYVRDLLSNMSGTKYAKKRMEMGIDTHSVVQVNCPEHLFEEVLPPNVVLFDTPGLGEDFKSDEVITESCREADIIVAVMGATNPSKATVSKIFTYSIWR